MTLLEILPISITLGLITFWGFIGMGWIITSDQRNKEDKWFVLQCATFTVMILLVLGLIFEGGKQ